MAEATMDPASEAALNRRVVEETFRIGQALGVLNAAGIVHAELVNYRPTDGDEAAMLDVPSKLARTKEAVQVRDDLLIALATNQARVVNERLMGEIVELLPVDEKPKVQVGDIVLWKVTKEAVDKFYEDTNGGVSPQCNIPLPGAELPMIVTAVWGPNSISGIAFLDGNATAWCPSITEGVGDDEGKPGTWRQR